MPLSAQKYRPEALVFLILGILTLNLNSQTSYSFRKGIHQEESEFYSRLFPKEYPSYNLKGAEVPAKLFTGGTKAIAKKALGWHPYWASSSAYIYYDYEALSHIAYFSYEIDTATGGYTTIRGWDSTPLIDYAHQKGTKVLLTVTNFGLTKNDEILSDTAKQRFLLRTLISLLKSRNGDGVNFDFESVNFSQRANLVGFISMAVTMIKDELPDAEISMATPAVDWSNAFNLKALSELCDYLIVMGYNYYWSSSATAGPVAPLSGETYNVISSINTYLNSGVTPEKLFLGVPWYGLDWPVASEVRKSKTTGNATSRTYSSSQVIAGENVKIFDETTRVPWLSYHDPTSWRQMWFEDPQSLSLKYNLVNSMKLGGTGIWALSYEGGYKEVWSTLRNAFSGVTFENNSIVRIYPNPVKGIAEIQFAIVSKTHVILKVFDFLGKELVVLADRDMEAGFYTEEFNAGQFGQGIYLCVLKTGKRISACKLIVTK